MAGYAYATVAALRDRLTGAMASYPEARLLGVLEAASEAVDDYAERTFTVRDGTVDVEVDSDYLGRVYVPDFLSASALHLDDGGGGAYQTQIDQAEWRAFPHDAPSRRRPYTAVEFYYRTGLFRGSRLRLTGKFGFWERLVSTGASLTAGVDADDNLTVNTIGLLPAGTTGKVDSEKFYVTSNAANPIVVDRGVGGTTAAAHLTAATITREEYPPAVVEAVLAVSGRRLAAVPPPGISSESFGDLSFSYRDPTGEEEYAIIAQFLPPSMTRRMVLA